MSVFPRLATLRVVKPPQLNPARHTPEWWKWCYRDGESDGDSIGEEKDDDPITSPTKGMTDSLPVASNSSQFADGWKL